MRHGVTLIELTVVLLIIGVLCAIGIPSLLRFLDRTHVRHATDAVVTMMALARTTSIARGTYVVTHFDSPRSSVTVRASLDTIVTVDLAAAHGVSIRSNRDSTVYGPTGLGYGAANQTIVVARGRAVDSIVVSRLGRVRR